MLHKLYHLWFEKTSQIHDEHAGQPRVGDFTTTAMSGPLTTKAHACITSASGFSISRPKVTPRESSQRVPERQPVRRASRAVSRTSGQAPVDGRWKGPSTVLSWCQRISIRVSLPDNNIGQPRGIERA